MRFIDEFRDPEIIENVLSQIHSAIKQTNFTAQKPMQIMEVCGGHTHSIFKFGIERLLPKEVEFIHGPGCPVCVLPMGRIDSCVEIASRPDVIFTTFGDAMRVPGRHGSLLDARQRGANVRIVYSPIDALQIAQQNPDKKVVFFGIGFETTMPSTAITIKQAEKLNLKNFYLFCQHITLIPTLRSLLQQPDIRIDGFLAPGHVSIVIGQEPYQFISSQYHKPLVIAGFEPSDLLQGTLMLIQQYAKHDIKIENQYKRVVPAHGNPIAQNAINDVFCMSGDSEWRGLGVIPSSRVTLKPKWQHFDAELYFNPQQHQVADDPTAHCGDVLTGRCKPADCKLFGAKCTPESAYGALMVSSEGACAAMYQYRRQSA